MGKRVAIVTPVFPPYRGGIGTVAAQDAAALSALGFEVHVYAPAKGDSMTEDAALPYAVHRLKPWLRLGHGAFVPTVGSLLREFDLTILQYPFFGGAEPLWLSKKLGAKGKLATVYHMDVEGAGALKPFIAAHARLVTPSIIRSSDVVIPTTKDYCLHGAIGSLLKAHPERFSELPPSVDTSRFAPGPKSEALLSQYGIAPGTKVIMFVGGLDTPHYFKGVPMLLAALSDPRLAGAHALIVGDGDLRASFEELARKQGVAKRVTFAGNISDAALPDHYRLGDVFAFPSLDRSEAFGIVALEAAACGLPVVASDLPGVRTVVREGSTGRRVTAGAVPLLASALADILFDEPLRKKFGAAGAAMAAAEYSLAGRPERWRKILSDFHLA
jgi:glycosyltransferase involved in cell wall biosynthesis